MSLGRHRRNCSVCAHPEKFDIEAEFVAWRSPAALALQYGVNRAAIYRHSHAFNLFSRRRHNLRSALERLIERVDEVEVTASAVVSAVVALARINAEGEWIEPSVRVSLHELFERMSRVELQAYAETGKLPGWFPATATNEALTGGGE